MFNDDAGFELVNLQAQRDLNSLVKNDERRHVNRDRTTTIDKDETITVHGKRTEIVDLDETITIHKNRQERVDDNETLDIGGNRTETVHKSEQITIKGNRDKTVNGNDTLTVNKNRKETVNKSRSLTVDKNNTELVKMAKSVTVGLAYATQVGTVMNTAVGIMQTEQVGRIKKTFVGKSYSIIAGDTFEISVGSSKITMTEDSISITAKTILVAAENKNVLINPPGAVDGGGDESEPDYLNDDPPEYDENGDPILGSDNGHVNRTKTNADFAKETAMMNGRFSEVAGKLNLVFKVNDKGHNIVCIPFGNEDCKPRANERYATKAEAGEGFKNLAMDVMPIPGGKGFHVVARKTGQVIGNFKDAKSARKAIEDAKIRNNNQIDDDLGNKPSGRPEYNPNSEYNGGLVRVPKPDPDADALADRIGGQSRVKFANSQREFDVVSDKYVGQAKPANYNFNKTGRDQAKATFDAARDNGKKVYYHFDGPPHKDTIRTLERYSKEYNIPVVIDTKPF